MSAPGFGEFDGVDPAVRRAGAAGDEPFGFEVVHQPDDAARRHPEPPAELLLGEGAGLVESQ